MRKKVYLIIALVLLVLFLSGMTYSLFTDAINTNITTDLATFVVDAKKTNQIDIPLENINPGESIDYDFQIANNSDVNILYNITIKTMHFIPFNISIVDDEDNEVMVCDETTTRNLHNELECKSQDIFKSYYDDKNDNYTLKLEFPSEYNTLEYSSLVDYINLEISSVQKIN